MAQDTTADLKSYNMIGDLLTYHPLSFFFLLGPRSGKGDFDWEECSGEAVWLIGRGAYVR